MVRVSISKYQGREQYRMSTPKDIPQSSQERSIHSEWLATQTEAVDRATQGSGLITRFHELFTQSGLSVGYMIADVSQISTGFPFPVYSRYIMPILESEEVALNPDKDAIHPGLAIINIMAGRRAVYVQIGLGQADLYKIAVVGQAYANQRGDEFPTESPAWWPNDIDASVTHLRLEDVREGVPEEHSDAFWWTPPHDERIPERLIYEEEKPGFARKTTWDAGNSEIVRALEAQKALIQTVLDSRDFIEQ